MKRLLSAALLLLSAACTTVQPPPAEPVHVVVVGTTDVHGWFNGRVETPSGGGQGVAQGGLAPLASYVSALRAANQGRVIVVDSGDVFQGTLESNLFEGEPMIHGYNEIGYAAAAVGNHEFDFGPVGPDAVARKPGDDPLGALKKNAAMARFPFLSANMVEKASRQTPAWAKRYTIVDVGGVQVGIIGLSTPDTPNVTMASNVVDLEFTDPVPSTIAAAAELRSRGADAIVVIAHMGGRCTRLDDPHSLDSCDDAGEAMELMEKLPQGTVDALFAGHTHARMRHYVNGIAALQAAPHSREFSTLDLWVDARAGRVVKTEMRNPTMVCTLVHEGTETCDPKLAPAGAKLIPRSFEGRTIGRDAEVAGTLAPYLQRVAAKRDEKTGIRTTEAFTRSSSGESPLGNLIADALREFAGADAAIMNSGGIRSDLPAGDVNYGAIFTVSPFDNYPAVVTMTGAELVELLRLTSNGDRAIMQVSGIRYTIETAGGSKRVANVTLSDGRPVDPEALYRVVMPDFIAAGGDGSGPVLSRIPKERTVISYELPIRDALVQVLSKRPQPIQPQLDGRITVVR